MSTYEPGQVAVATVRGVPNVRVIRDDRKDAWLSGAIIDGFQWHLDRTQVTDIRPLVVLDLDSANECISRDEVVRAAIETLRESQYLSDSALADQIEQQTKPPRIPEPGLWGVVEAWRSDQTRADACTWVKRRGLRPWRCDCGKNADWSDLIDPVLVRPGIEDES